MLILPISAQPCHTACVAVAACRLSAGSLGHGLAALRVVSLRVAAGLIGRGVGVRKLEAGDAWDHAGGRRREGSRSKQQRNLAPQLIKSPRS
jgi:hypothetical protein